MKIDALFTDYDGTIAPHNVKREDSNVPRGVFLSLERLSKKVPVAVVTSKDIGFVRPRTPFAAAWAAASGLDVVFADGRAAGEEAPDAGAALAKVRDIAGCEIEEKRASNGKILGFCLDWTGMEKPAGATEAIALLKREGVSVDEDPDKTYADVYPVMPDKGRALASLKKALGVSGAVMYLGDSQFDNSAFDASDAAVGVDHGQDLAKLRCGTFVRYGEVADFLDGLGERGMEWDRGVVKS